MNSSSSGCKELLSAESFADYSIVDLTGKWDKENVLSSTDSSNLEFVCSDLFTDSEN